MNPNRRIPVFHEPGPIKPEPAKGLVLLSGGLDSVAALHWAKRSGRFDDLAALTVYYGQPHAHAEATAAGALCKRLDVPWIELHAADLIRGLQALTVPAPGVESGVSRANVPGRNMILLAAAGAECARRWPGQSTAAIIGCNADDSATFPDCRTWFLSSAGDAIRQGINGVVSWFRVEQPWSMLRKADIVRWAYNNGALSDARQSVSCYAGTRCGACDACQLRASAFAANGLDDGDYTPPVCGGDPHREAR